MLIALLALLGVDLVALVALGGFVLTRKRWVTRQPGAFRGAIRVADGDVDGLSSKWRRGYGRWIRDVLVWTKAPFLFRNELLAVDGFEEQRRAAPGEIKRLGDRPVVIRLRAAAAQVELAAEADRAEQLLGPYSTGAPATAGVVA